MNYRQLPEFGIVFVKKLLLLMLMLLAITCLYSQQYDDKDDFEFEIVPRREGEEGCSIEALVTGYRGTNTIIKIPAYFGDNDVITIG